MVTMIAQPNPRVEQRTESVVGCRALGRTIDGRRILRDISVHIPSGQFTALLGANGAGKSTLLRILATLIPPTTGTLHLFGQLAGRDSVAIRRRIGLIGHGSMLYRDLSAMENLLFFGRLYSIKNPEAQARKLLDFVGLSTRRCDAVKVFSRGMVQRISIARALMHDPDLLLADEPFHGLDAPSSRIIEHMLTDLASMGKTVVLATHDIHQCLALADHAIVLGHGQVVIDRAVDELDHGMILREIEGG